jgi:Ca2+-binding EF-hand superfamily protein
MANRTVPAHILEKFDKDGDGKLSDDERAEIRKEMMAKFDMDGDGKLGPEERKAAMAARSKLMQGKGKKGGEKKGGEKGKKKKGEDKKKKQS